MKRTLPALALLLLLTTLETTGLDAADVSQPHRADSESSAVYSCDVLEIKQLAANGTLRSTEWTSRVARYMDTIMFDEASGLLRDGSPTPWQLEVLQYGSKKNSLMAIRLYDGPASYVVSLLRIETWKEGMPFLYVFFDEVITGTCKRM